MGQGQDCFGFFGEDRIWIHELPWRAWDREKPRTAACDPTLPYFMKSFSLCCDKKRRSGKNRDRRDFPVTEGLPVGGSPPPHSQPTLAGSTTVKLTLS
jgi:hypothetical protein